MAEVLIADTNHPASYFPYEVRFSAHRLVSADVATLDVVLGRRFDYARSKAFVLTALIP
jgi:hypothetical protein